MWNSLVISENHSDLGIIKNLNVEAWYIFMTWALRGQYAHFLLKRLEFYSSWNWSETPFSILHMHLLYTHRIVKKVNYRDAAARARSLSMLWYVIKAFFSCIEWKNSLPLTPVKMGWQMEELVLMIMLAIV